jgi:hypothetical protein
MWLFRSLKVNLENAQRTKNAWARATTGFGNREDKKKCARLSRGRDLRKVPNKKKAKVFFASLEPCGILSNPSYISSSLERALQKYRDPASSGTKQRGTETSNENDKIR